MTYKYISNDTFGAVYAAKCKAQELGFATGSMERDEPIGVFNSNSEYCGDKWRYVDAQGKRELVGVIKSNDFRDGDVELIIFDCADKNPWTEAQKGGIDNMIAIKVLYENGDEVFTRINATIEEAQDYYLNKVFNLGSVNDDMQRCVDVVLLSE